MFKQPAYLYKNTQYLYTDLVPTSMGYRKVYARALKLHKGIDNSIELQLLNGEQKKLSVAGSTLYWQLLDRDTAELKLQKLYSITPYDNSIVTISVNEEDMDQLNTGYYQYSVHIVDTNGKRSMLYGDSQFGPTIPVEIVGNSFPQIYPSVELTEFVTAPNPGDLSLYTSPVDARPASNKNNQGLHTIEVASTNFIGVVEIQATMENSISGTTWSVVTTVTVTDSLIYKNFNGIFSWVRFHIIPSLSNTGTVDKILYRS
jgi:hypothetical protein